MPAEFQSKKRILTPLEQETTPYSGGDRVSLAIVASSFQRQPIREQKPGNIVPHSTEPRDVLSPRGEQQGRRPSTRWRWRVKRSFDLVLASLALLILSPLLLAVILAIRLDSEGPAVFRQTRVGRDGRLFDIWKFRSMVNDAQARLPEVEALNQAQAPYFKIRDDPRVTPVGRFLRRFYIDELAQLVNVVKGEMSLVGPRPVLPTEFDARPDLFAPRLLLPPGITGLWQVTGRSWLPAEVGLELDLRYIATWGLWTDLRILGRTLAVAVGGDRLPMDAPTTIPMGLETADLLVDLRLGQSTRRPTESRKVSVVVVTHQSAADIRDCLRSLEPEVAAGWAEVIVVDNASSDGTAELIRSEFGWVRLISNAVRKGFAANSNQGSRYAQGEYLMLLNPDAQLTAGALERMVAHLAAHPAAGVVGPQLRYPDGSLQSSARRFPNLHTTLLRRTPLRLVWKNSAAEQRHLSGADDLSRPSDVDWLLGAALMFRRSTYLAVGGLDEGYRLYCEDMDICWRLHRLGREVHYLPSAIGYHSLSEATRRRFLTRLTWWHFRSMIRVLRRNGLAVLRAGAAGRIVLSHDRGEAEDPNVVDLRDRQEAPSEVDAADALLSGAFGAELVTLAP